MKFHTSPKQKWIFIAVCIPLFPFITAGLLRLLITWQLDWYTFSGSEITICLALLSFFVAQSLHSCNEILPSSEKEDDRRNATRNYYLLGTFFLVIFVLITIFSTLNSDVAFTAKHFNTQLQVMQSISFIASPIMVLIASRTQETYRLTAKLI